MVKYTSEGVFDADIKRVWKLLTDEHTPDTIRKVHTNMGPVKIIESEGTRLVQEQESTGLDGKPFKQRIQFDMEPPKGFTMAWLSGPLKGSKAKHVYTPLGEKTKVSVTGDFTIDGMDDRSTLKMVDEMMTGAFEEDNAFMKKHK